MSTVSKDIIVVIPNGRRQKVHCSPDTTLLQVLEDACAKHGFEATKYDLKHHNHILDPSTTVRFSNLPNKATLELVESDKQRQESNVTVGLLLEDGDRRTADFPPNTSLFELITSLAPSELKSLQNPCIMFMRQEVTGLSALQGKTLRQLGLLGGRAILRLRNKAEEAKQANVSAIYRVPIPDNNKQEYTKEDDKPTPKPYETSQPGPSGSQKKTDFKPNMDPLKLVKEAKQVTRAEVKENNPKHPTSVTPSFTPTPTTTSSVMTQENLERRLRIEEEVTFLGAQKAIVFKQPDNNDDQLNDLPDDFYELTIEEVRNLYKELQQRRMELEDTPLLTTDQRQSVDKQQKGSAYKNVVVRIQFPDRIILQGVFAPTNTIADIITFIKKHLNSPNRPFHIFTTPLKERLDPRMTLLEAKFVPCVHMHFKWDDDGASHTTSKYLKEELYAKQTPSDAASLLASKFRAPSRRKIDEATDSQRSPSTSKHNKMPKWFKR